MALNRDFVGRSYPSSSPYEVSRVKIKEFAAAIGDSNPIYRDRDAARAAGHPDVVAPPTFPIVFSLQSGGGRWPTPTWASTSPWWSTASSVSSTRARSMPATSSSAPPPSPTSAAPAATSC